MNQAFRRLLSLLAVFLITFAVVFLIRNGTDGVRRLFDRDESGGNYRPEAFTLPDKAPLELGDVELLTRLNEEAAQLTDAVIPSVVSIDTTGVREQRLLDGYGRQYVRGVPTQGQGSGVIVSHEGHVVTNQHVIRGQKQIQITLYDGRIHAATLIGEDPISDIAVLKIKGDGPFQPLKFGDSSKVRRGQMVFAIGNPFGLGETVTQGIISALERSLSDTQRDLFQTDAAINPGNSGGPLVNLRGEIIGINSAIYRPEGMNAGFQGVGFSIPANDVRDVLYAILKRGRPIRGYLGLRMLPLDRRAALYLGYEGHGAVVRTVSPESPAERAGLEPLDVVRQFDGREVTGVMQVIDRVKSGKVGETIPIEVWRKGEILELEATLVEASVDLMPKPESPRNAQAQDTQRTLAAVGLTVAASTQGGVVVQSVKPGGLADGRLEAGDYILSINRNAISSVEDFEKQLAASVVAQATTLEIVRGQKVGQVRFPVLPSNPE